MKTIYFDMDGTLASLFFVKGYAKMLDAKDSTPYAIAGTLFKADEMKTVIDGLKSKGYSIGIISYTGKDGDKEFAKEVEKVKREWLAKNFPYADSDKIHIVSPETPKVEFAKSADDILVDDAKKNREEWEKTGRTAINAYFRAPIKMLDALKALI